MVSYATTIRKSIKWYRKLALRESLVSEWSSENTVPDNHRKKTTKVAHHLEIRKNLEGKPIRRMCTLCYKKKRQTVSREEARKNMKRTTTYCSKCPKSPQMCLECFNEYYEI
ncbi:uncharacterized protein LOC117162215 [Bombus vancouverensis nearcticus]|uniref:Uncharacterized protein LOC117213274 n=1 Tax=Bombus bifarius TaxID=103933 RepID=A0A6P8NJ31_9HYME|nr:uncharacterized protein LOC117162215 [Bombus vancouverensis nearcticus]XP_033314532.1 uncharacterized protein LOC117213274 [Bombus bifarius]